MPEKNKKGCCKDEHKQLKIEKVQQKTNYDYNFSFKSFPAIFTTSAYYSSAEKKITKNLLKANAPPPKQGAPIYILNCTYQI